MTPRRPRLALALVPLLALLALAPVASGPAAAQNLRPPIQMDWCAVFRGPTPGLNIPQACVPYSCSFETCGSTEAYMACQFAEQVVGNGMEEALQWLARQAGAGGQLTGAWLNISLMAVNILSGLADLAPEWACGNNIAGAAGRWQQTCVDFGENSNECIGDKIIFVCSCGRNETARNTHETLIGAHCRYCDCYRNAAKNIEIGRFDLAREAAIRCYRQFVPAPPPFQPPPPPRVNPPNNRTRGRTYADPYIATFDGQRHNFMKVGEFLAVRTPQASGADYLEVQIRTAPWSGSQSVSMNTAVALRAGADRVAIYVDQDPPVRVNGSPVTVSAESPLALAGGGEVRYDGAGSYIVATPGGDEINTTLRNVGTPSAFLDIDVGLLEGRLGTVAGLFGDFDRDPGDDTVPEGDLRITAAESLFDYGPGESTATFTDLGFPYAGGGLDTRAPMEVEAARTECAAAGVTDPTILDQCANDLLNTGTTVFLESAAEAAGNEATAAALDACAAAPPGTICVMTENGPCTPAVDELTGEVRCEPLAGAVTEPPGPTPPPPPPSDPTPIPPPPPPPPGSDN